MNSNVEIREITKKKGRIELVMTIYQFDQDICIMLWGGSSHVGAVAVSIPDEVDNSLWTIDLPHHKDIIIAEKTAKIVRTLTNQKVTVICGIHYDKIKKSEIQEIMLLTEKMAREAVEKWRA